MAGKDIDMYVPAAPKLQSGFHELVRFAAVGAFVYLSYVRYCVFLHEKGMKICFL